jgi:hypothetical protein
LKEIENEENYYCAIVQYSTGDVSYFSRFQSVKDLFLSLLQVAYEMRPENKREKENIVKSQDNKRKKQSEPIFNVDLKKRGANRKINLLIEKKRRKTDKISKKENREPKLGKSKIGKSKIGKKAENYSDEITWRKNYEIEGTDCRDNVYHCKHKKCLSREDCYRVETFEFLD